MLDIETKSSGNIIPQPLDVNELQPGDNNITFISKTMGGDLTLAGLLFLPEGFDPQQQYPTIILSGPFNQVKEQTCALYGRKFAAQGYVALSFVHLGIDGRKKTQAKLESANEARQHWYETGETTPFDALGFDDGTAQSAKIRDQREGYDYYMTARAGAATYPNYTHKTPEFFVEDSARYNARAIARYLRTPTISIHGSKASTRFFSWLFHWAKKGPKKRVAIKGATHVDLYDRDEYVDQVIRAATDYFQ